MELNKDLERLEFFNGAIICKYKAATNEDFKRVFNNKFVAVKQSKKGYYRIDVVNSPQVKWSYIIQPSNWLMFSPENELLILSSAEVLKYLEHHICFKTSYKL